MVGLIAGAIKTGRGVKAAGAAHAARMEIIEARAAAGGRTTGRFRNQKGQYAGTETTSSPPSERQSVMDKEKSNSMLQMVVDTMKIGIDALLKPIKKVLRRLEQASPLFAQQLQIMKKAWLLFWRPMGDFLGKLLRPLAILLLKVGLLAYKFFSKMFGTGPAPGEDSEDAGKKGQEAESRLDGEPPRSMGGKYIGGQSADFQPIINYTDSTNRLEELFAPIADWIQGKDTSQSLEPSPGEYKGNVFKPAADEMQRRDTRQSLASDTKEEYPNQEELDNVKKVIEFFQPLTEIIDAGKLKLTEGFEKAKEYLEKETGISIDDIALTIKQIGIDTEKVWKDESDTWPTKVGKTLVGAFSGIKSAIRDWWKEKFGLKKKDDDDDTGNASGILKVPETGRYKLHAGETVLRAGDSQRMSSAQSTNITNNFTINATINNDIDIQHLASRLAALNEIELRRRVSY